ncbi:aminotransferase class I/II-fold pyridoxal phosphate-dependent enzyme [Ferroplasma sp.]|uniref:aminotransferase class I/II-fold pyridoxal phosphate-dependent enzyme n=1 Tax=Ferroplasma sp. TaxID=2591003 RepID=UPI00307F19A2
MHGGNVYEFALKYNIDLSKILDFSANMNDFITVKNLFINKGYIEHYPESNLEEYKKILAGSDFSINNITMVSGLTSFIHLYMNSIKGNSLIISPSFTEYIKSNTSGNKILLPFNAINKNPEMIKNYNYETLFLVYPDSPTGQMMNEDSIHSIIETSMKKNSTIFIDESFIWFVNNRKINEKEMIEKYNNVIIGRSLTKVLSIPGLRLGYVLSNSDTISEIEKTLEPWRINQGALLYLQNYMPHFSGLGKKIEIERKYLIKSLEKQNFTLIGKPQANYITFKLPENINGEKLMSFLATRNIMIRLLDDYCDFGSNYIRINVKRRIKNRILVKNIKGYLGDAID